MNERSALALSGLLLAGPLLAQPSFTSRPDLLPVATHSAVCMGVADMNGDGRDDIGVLDGSTHFRVFYQNPDGTFIDYDYGQVEGDQQWGMALADVDGNGHKDVLAGSFQMNYLRIAAPGQAQPVTVLPNSNFFVQCVSIGDMDNDGWLDGFACNDNGAPGTWRNNGSGALSWADIVDFSTNPASDMSGNYGSVFTDFDLDGDIDFYLAHCRQGVNDPNDPRRWDRLFVNDGTGHFTDEAAARGVLNTWQTWAVDFGDWDNDGDLDLVTVNHDRDMQLMENDGTGHFTEIDDNNLDLTGFLLEVHMEDFDNDGFLDIMIGGGPDYYLQGHGDGTFTRVDGLFPADKSIKGFAIGDLNNDGAMDLWASYGDGYTTPDNTRPDRIWLNNGNENHWLNVRLQGVESNRDALGAHVVLSTPLGTQVREVRSGESYGMTNTAMCHFGLGANTIVPTITVTWPSGQVDTYTDVPADQTLVLVEGGCSTASIAITSSTSSFTLCPGAGTLTLTASGTGDFSWSTGDNTASIVVEQAGYYTVTRTTDGCTASSAVFVPSTSGPAPVVTAAGSLSICPGESVTLTSTEANSYHWTTGETTQSITVDEAGDYFVTVDNGCPGVNSNTLTVELLPAPEAPTSADVSIPTPGTAELTASSTDVVWYDVATGGSPVGSGSPWTTPFIEESTTFWCAVAGPTESATIHAGVTDIGPGAQQENDDGYYPLFTATEPFTLMSVKVRAGSAGPRVIALVDPVGGVISQATYTLPFGESRVQLDLDIAPGSYGLRVIGAPDLTWENAEAYPYAIGTVGQITGVRTPSGGTSTQYWEDFYDWEVLVGEQGCESARTPVQVLVGPTGIPDAGTDGFAVYPNPASGVVSIAFGTYTGAVMLDLLDLTGRVVRSERRTAGGTVQQLDLNGLAVGGYTLRIAHEGGILTKPLVVR